MLYPGRRVHEFQGIMLFRVKALWFRHLLKPLHFFDGE
jgi:hypothetical protein